MMKTWEPNAFPAPAAKQVLAEKCWLKILIARSLGIAISEAVEDAVTSENTKYSLGSVLNHVMLHQTVIGLEAQKQFEMIGDYPDVLIGCVGGGSNFPDCHSRLSGIKFMARIFRLLQLSRPPALQ